ncbi:YmfQ family protein [Gluconacetobacter diazotrophicus]|uniref:Putative bacteriophage related protein n=1 Tax=Gluconacetobacter diazotrophicus (strain ATCC 49037 / DSM 5601 / CCUG 37298 / CIP 103539 / LMG 7603 / PAl5) TaxID=272568 RepID=A9H6J7_GLUDA|nr:putative phage tail protein [Gluconacetobacter diazotrophicus]CAP57506.1 putative bacteriophage related protein [Gluconacetobacter diazotrophicus PA1 5]
MAAPSFSLSDFRSALLRLLPTGPIWSREPGSLPYLIAAVWAPTFQRNGDRASNLLADAFPSTAVELLPEWESTLGLPDPCAGTSPTIEQRQAQVVARLTDNGGSSIAYYTALAKSLGYDITITQYVPSRFGKTFGGTFGGDAWAYAWKISAPQFTIQQRQFGNAFGEPYATWGNTVLQCEIRTRAPAHTVLLWDYGGQGNPAVLGTFEIDFNTLE